MIKKYLTVIFFALILVGCKALNFEKVPETQSDCQYDRLNGIEFSFNQLTDDALTKGFVDVYVAQSKSSATLSSSYQGMKGKLTDVIIERNYPQTYLWHRHFSPFRHSLFYDDSNSDFYLTSKQREERLRKTKSIFRQAVLQNCQIVYISIDSLSLSSDNPFLIEDAALKIINNKSRNSRDENK